jgi:hypothetical protein
LKKFAAAFVAKSDEVSQAAFHRTLLPLSESFIVIHLPSF